MQVTSFFRKFFNNGRDVCRRKGIYGNIQVPPVEYVREVIGIKFPAVLASDVQKIVNDMDYEDRGNFYQLLLCDDWKQVITPRMAEVLEKHSGISKIALLVWQKEITEHLDIKK